nr:IS3 family transposase [Pseudomonas boanensis]
MIAQEQGKKASIARLCRLFGASRSGFYASLCRDPGSAMHCPVIAPLKASFLASGRAYGSRRLQATLNAQGVAVGRHRIRRLMKEHRLRPVWRRKFVHTTDSKHDLPVAANVLERQFDPAAANRAWAADITYIRTRSGWLYLAAVMDLYSRKIWAGSWRRTCRQSWSARRCKWPLPNASRNLGWWCIRIGAASEAHRNLLARHGLVMSMSRKGNCWDNAVMERFFLNLKMERVWHRDYANHAEAMTDIADYIVGFYNAVRLHSRLGYLSPNRYERQAATHPIEVSEII